jgi:hypothetical protein
MTRGSKQIDAVKRQNKTSLKNLNLIEFILIDRILWVWPDGGPGVDS